MVIEYFTIKNSKDIYALECLKKPSWKENLEIKRRVKAEGEELIIGINHILINNIIEEYKNLKLKNHNFGKEKDDSYAITNHFQLPKAIIRIVLNSRDLHIK